MQQPSFRRSRRAALLVAVSFASTFFGGLEAARAQDSDGAAALTLFEEGKKLASEGDYQQGCPKLLASYRLVEKLGTLLNLADCYERSGRTASAWVRFTEAATIAERAGQQERTEFARAHAAALAPRLSRIAITVTGPAAAGLVVRRDGTIVDSAGFGSSVPVDPGPHTVEASAPGHRTWTTTVVVELDALAERAIAIPTLAPEPEARVTRAPPPSPPLVGDPAAETAPAPVVTPRPSPQRTFGIVAGGVGLAGIAASLSVGIFASRRYEQSNSEGGCVNDRCSARGLDDRSSASTLAAVSTGLFVGGAVLLGTGVVLFLTAPKARTKVSLGPTSLTLGRTW